MRMKGNETGYDSCNRNVINLDLRYLFGSYSYTTEISSPYIIPLCYKEKQDDLGKKMERFFPHKY